MTFQEALSAIRQAKPDAEIGLTARRGKYYEQARHMEFTRTTPTAYSSEGPRGTAMWLYVSERHNRICCGNKNY